MKNVIISFLVLFLLGKKSICQIYTPNGVQVPAYALGTYSINSANGTTDAQLQAGQNAILNGLFGNSVTLVSGYSRNYNCHGYAWHVSTGGSQIGIDQPNAGGVDYYTGGSNPSYTQIANNNTVKLRVRYTGDHSAVTTSTPGVFISKWGAGGLYRHNSNHVPNGTNGYANYGAPSTYWTCNYTPPLTAPMSIDFINQSSSSFPLANGAHVIRTYTGLDPDTGPIFGSTNPNTTTITSQSGNSANFNFNGNNGLGMLNVQFCGAVRYAWTFWKSGGARMSVYPNPATEEATVELLKIENGTELIPAMEDKLSDIKISELKLFDSNNNLKRSYLLTNDESSKGSIKFDKDLKGVYYLKAFFSDGTTQVKRIQIGKQ